MNPSNLPFFLTLESVFNFLRSLHPVYPGLATGPESAIDFNQYDLLDLRVCPDVLIVPSRLKQFAKVKKKYLVMCIFHFPHPVLVS